MIGRAILLAAILVGVAACSTNPSSEQRETQVVVTTGVLANVVADLVGDDGSVQALMAPGVDPHDFTPSAQAASLLRSADLVVANGLGLEAGLTALLEEARAEGTNVLELGEHVDPLPFGGSTVPAEEELADDVHDHGAYDPHFTLDPLRMADAMDVVVDALSDLDDSVDWQGRGAEVRSDLESLHREIEQEVSVVPADQRKLVTNHDALGYFADRYDFEVVGTVIPGGSTMAEPSASDLARLATMVRREGVKAVFADTTASLDLVETVAAEAGEGVEVYQLYTGSLGPEGSGAETYAGMMRTNAATIAAALGS